MSRVGRVYLVGAGPGHPGLITVEALRLLKQADAVVFDRLVPEELLQACRPDALRLYVGKAPGKHASRQTEINQLLARLATEHRLVVRLKGGDPFVFGRGGEEAEYLAEHGIPCAVVPGVTSALAAPAAAGIPVTHRDHACSFAVVTGHERADACEDRIDWAALARIDTVVVLMGVHSIERVAGHLIAAGRSPDTPAALVESAYWAGERTVVGTLGTIGDMARDEQVCPPATLVIGEVVRLREQLAPAAELPWLAALDQPTPGPSRAALDRMVAGLREARVLLAVLEVDLFDDFEQQRAIEEIAALKGLALSPLVEACDVLVQAQILLAEDGLFRNSELASRYLCTTSPEYLGDLVREQLRRSLQFRLSDSASALPVRTGQLAAHAV